MSQAALRVNTRTVQGVSILDLSGSITIGVGDITLRESVRQLLDDGVNKILLNMANVSVVDSSGIGELVSSYTMSNNRGARLKLLNVTRKVYDLLMITRLLTVFETFDDEQEALASFSEML